MRIIFRSALRAIGARLGWVLVGLVLLGVGIDAKASNRTATVNADGSGIVGRNTRFPAGYFPTNTHASGTSIPIRGEAAVSSVSAAAGGPIANAASQVAVRDPYGRITNIPVSSALKVPTSTMAAAARLGLRTIPAIATAAVILDALTAATISPSCPLGALCKTETLTVNGNNSGTKTAAGVFSGATWTVAPPANGTAWPVDCAGAIAKMDLHAQPEAVCYVTGTPGFVGKWRTTSTSCSLNSQTTVYRNCDYHLNGAYTGGNVGYGYITSTGTITCPTGSVKVGNVCQQTSDRLATDAELESAMSAPTDANEALILGTIVDAGQNVGLPAGTAMTSTVLTPTFSTPVVSSTRTYTDGTGTHTEVTESHSEGTVTTSGSTTNNNTVTTNVTTITNIYLDGNLVSTTETEEPQSGELDDSQDPPITPPNGPQFDQDAARTGIVAQAQTNPGSGKFFTVPGFGDAACTSISLDVPGATNWTIPGATGCAFLDKLKLIVAFFLYIGTAFTIYLRFQESI